MRRTPREGGGLEVGAKYPNPGSIGLKTQLKKQP